MGALIAVIMAQTTLFLLHLTVGLCLVSCHYMSSEGLDTASSERYEGPGGPGQPEASGAPIEVHLTLHRQLGFQPAYQLGDIPSNGLSRYVSTEVNGKYLTSSEHSMPSANLVSTEKVSARYVEDAHT